MWAVILIALAIVYAIVVHYFALIGGVVLLGQMRIEARRAKAGGDAL